MLRIDLASRVPVYEQIANGLRAELVSGKFSPGDKLPTVRTLAVDFGVHHDTVAEAYRQLANEGWLELKRHQGQSSVNVIGPQPDRIRWSGLLGRYKNWLRRG